METINRGGELRVAPEYILKLGAESIGVNSLVGQKIRIEFLNEIYCIKCGRKTKKAFGQGFCYPCLISALVYACFFIC